jgi:hypothetical protein
VIKRRLEIHGPSVEPGFPKLCVQQYVFGWLEMFTAQRLPSSDSVGLHLGAENSWPVG